MNELRKPGIVIGLFVGGLTVTTYLITYIVGKQAYFGTGVNIVTWVIYLLGMWKASVDSREVYKKIVDIQQEGYSFSQALQGPFLVFLIAQVIYYIYYWILFNWIDPEMVELSRTFALESIPKYYGSFMNEDQIETLIEQLEQRGFEVTVSGAFFGWAQSLIGGFLISAIYALFFKKSRNKYA